MTDIINKPIVWSVAGSDNSGGAGIQADNLTFHDYGVHGCNIITAITAQSSTTVSAVACTDENLFFRQWDSLIEDYYPQAIKLGMLGNDIVINALVEKLGSINTTVVCDPVLSSTSGTALVEHSAAYHQLLPLIDVLTPNQQEFSQLFGQVFASPEQLESCAIAIARQYDLQLIITGGDSFFDTGYASDLCVINGQVFWLHSPKVATANTHGTGCTFSSAIAAALVKGYSLPDACVLGKAYINQGLQDASRFKAGKGPLQHRGFPAQINSLPVVSASGSPQSLSFPRIDTLQLGVYPVVDSVEWLERCLQEGIKTIQLRVKGRDADILDAMVAQAAALGRSFNARLFINDYWQLAIKHQAYGVHLGQEDLDTADLSAIAQAGLYLGVSTHSWHEIARAHAIRPSYIAIGPIYATTTKRMAFAPQGIMQLEQWVKMIGDSYPVVAIGGIDTGRVTEVMATGAGSVAMVRAVTEAADYRQALHELKRLVGE